MKKSSLFIGFLLSLIGLLLLIIPRQCVQAIVILLGIEAVANGIYSLMYTRKLIPDSSFQYTVICRGMLSIVIGLLAFFLPLKFAQAMWNIMLFVLAIYLIIGALLQMYATGKLRETGVDRKQFIIESIISICAAIVMFIIGAKSGIVFVRIVGTVVLLCGLTYLFFLWRTRPLVQEPVEVVDDISGTIEKSNE